jgi:hypothetical protein
MKLAFPNNERWMGKARRMCGSGRRCADADRKSGELAALLSEVPECERPFDFAQVRLWEPFFVRIAAALGTPRGARRRAE